MQSKFTRVFEDEAQAASYDGVEVINTRQDNYRRAGFVLKKGRNELPPVDYQTLLMLDSDPFLTVSIIGDSYVSENDSTTHHAPNSDISNSTKGSQTNPTDSPLNPSPDSNIENGAGKNGENPPSPTPPSRDERILTTANDALLATDPSIYFNQDGSASITKWKALLGDDSLTKDEINAALDAAKAAQKPE